jgi:hypothetical protein
LRFKCPVKISGLLSSPLQQYRTVSIYQNLRFGVDSDPARSPIIQSFPFQWFTNSPLDLTFPCEQPIEALFIRVLASTVHNRVIRATKAA